MERLKRLRREDRRYRKESVPEVRKGGLGYAQEDEATEGDM